MLTVSAPRDYYSPYPTLTQMRGPRGLGSLPGLPPDATSVALAARYRAMAAELGIKLPPRPKGETRGQAQALDCLEAVEIAGAYLSRISTQLFKEMAQGGAMCETVLRYNRLAIEIYEEQRGVLEALRQGGVSGVPLAPPWPPLFVGYGNHAAASSSSFWEIDCTEPSIQLASSKNPNGARLMMATPCDTGLGEVSAGVVIAVVAGVYLVADLVEGWFASSVETERIRGETQKTVENLRMLDARMMLIEKWRSECVKKGGDWFECNDSATDSVFDMEDVAVANEAAKIRKTAGGKGWLWWIGLGTVVVGGIVVYKVVKNRTGRSRRRPRAEIIEAD